MSGASEASVPEAASSPKVLYAVTDPMTALAFLRGQLGYLVRAGFDVHLACGRTEELDRFAADEGVTLHDVPLSRSWWSRGDVGSLLRAVRLLLRVRPDVLNYSTPKAAMVWAVASWFSRPPFVVYLLRGLRLEGHRTWTLGFAFLWLAEFLAARSSDVAVCVSRSLRRKAMSLRLIGEDDSRVFGEGSSNGVDIDRFSPPSPDVRQEARARYGLHQDRFVVGYVGRMTRDKGVPELLDAIDSVASELPEVQCLLVGSQEPAFDLESEVQRRPGAQAHTRWFAATPTAEQAYAALDVFVLPSHREGMSNALIEAQAMGIPCITTNATGCMDAVLPGTSALIVPVNDSVALARALIRLARDTALREGMGRDGRSYVVEHFSPKERWQDYAALYRSRLAVSPETSST
jgi:glycosyltransferase involved in cell wall biosynthesis